MNKKMMKRSLALGALMAFVITGSAMAADHTDLIVVDGDYTPELVEFENVNIVSEGEKLNGSSRYKGIAIDKSGKAKFVGEYTIVDLNNKITDSESIAVQLWRGGEAEFAATNTVISSKSLGGSGKWGYGLFLNGNVGSKAAFTGKDVTISCYQEKYTAQTLTTQQGSVIDFNNTGNVVIEASSPMSVTGVNAYGNITFNNSGNVTINTSIVPDTKGGNINSVGIQSYYSAVVNVTDKVNEFKIDQKGIGYDNDGTTYSTGNKSMDFGGEAKAVINSKSFVINALVDKDTDIANPSRSNIYYGIAVEKGSSVFVGENTTTDIIVDNGVGNAYGVYSNNRNGGGTIDILGDVSIKVYGAESNEYDKWAVYAGNDSKINIGSIGKNVSIVGDIVANNDIAEGDVKRDPGKINISGNSVFDGTKTQFIATDGGLINLAGGNMSGVLNIAKDSKVNLTGATFTANDLATGIVGGGKLVLTDSGVLSTTANQIFTKADTVGTDFVDNAITDIANEKVDFVSGTVSLTDKEYNFDFVQSAVDTMQKHNSSKTNVVMTGTLVGGVEDNNITVDQAAGLGDNVSLDKVTADADGNLLVGSTKADGDKVEEIEIKDSVANGFNVGSLELAAGSNGMVITNAQEVTLGGSEGGSVITVEKDADAKVNVVVGTSDVVDGASKTNGTLNIGNALANADTKYTLNGSVIVNNDSTLNTKGNTTITGDIELNNGTVNAVNGSLDVKFITVMEGDNNTITGSVYASALSVDKDDVVINIGNDKLAGNVVVEDANLNGAVVFLDPAFVNGIEDSSKLAVKNSSDLNGHYVAGQNSVMSFGVDNTADADKMFAKTGLEWKNDVTAAAYVAGNTNVANGSVVVNGSLTSAPAALANGTVSFADKSLLMVDGSKIKDTAALSGVTSAAIDQDSAKLYIDGAKKGETYHVIAGVDAGWADKNIISDNSLLEFKGDTETNSKYDVTASLKKVNDVYGNKVIIANVVDNTLDKHDTIAAADFFNAAVSSKNNASKDAQISALNSAGAMSELAGVAHSTYAVSNILTDTVADHVSMSNELDHDSDIWAHYVHNKENVKGLSVANFGADYDAQYNGIVVGGDFYKKDNVVAGAALTYVDGNINGSSLAARTENDAEYYGVSVYGSVTNDDNAVIGDISYLHGKNEITQHNSGFALTGEPESDAFSVGVRVEKAIETEAGKFVPYAGVRYMHVGTGNYTNSIGMSYDADDANLFLLPVGLKYSAEAKVGGMTIRPVAEVGYVWAMGDTDSAQTVSLNGAADGFGYDVTDEGSYFARIGVEAVSDNVTYGLGYEYQKGDSVKANKWMANLNFSF